MKRAPKTSKPASIEEASARAGLTRVLQVIKSDDDAFYDFILDAAQKFRQYDEDTDFKASIDRALAHVACMWSGNFDLFPEPKGRKAEAEWQRNLEVVSAKFEELQAMTN